MIEFAEQKAITGLTTSQNGDHEAGGCTVPVKTLQDPVAGAIIVGGIGPRPMHDFTDVGITFNVSTGIV